jgi:hypothetical protein
MEIDFKVLDCEHTVFKRLNQYVHPTWKCCDCGELALQSLPEKPRTLNINGFEVPYPLDVEPENDTKVWQALPYKYNLNGDLTHAYKITYDHEFHSQVFTSRLIHATQDAAEIHGRALASFFN